MKIKTHYLYRNKWRERQEDLSDVISLIKSGKYAKGAELFRDQLQAHIAYSNKELPESAEHLPIIEFDSSEEGQFNGIILLSLPVENREHTNRIRKIVDALPQAVCSFVGSSEKTLKILMRYVLTDGSLPNDAKSIALFRANAYVKAVAFLLQLTGIKAFNDEAQNTVCIEVQRSGIEAWDEDITRYVHSNLVEHYDSISLWLSGLPQWDGMDRVGELAATLKTSWSEWTDMFRVWMRSMVSQWRGLNQMYGATMVLMLTGKQGTGKSTFFKRLMPSELLTYYNDCIDFTNKKDAERALSIYIYLCI